MNIWKHRLAFAARGLAAALVAGGLGLAAMGARAEDDPPGRVGRLADMKGQVWLLEEGQGEWQAAVNNRPITTADRVATDRDSRVELQIGSTIIRIDQGSDLEINRLDDERIELTLHDGAAAVRVREPEVAREILITTAEGRFQPRSAGLYRIDHGERGSMAGATQGELDFESADSQLSLRAGQRAELWLDPNDKRTHYNWSTPANDDFEQWVRSDDARDERYAAQRPVSPEMTGAEDLDRNGQWGKHPEYGAIWYPTTVAVGWAPYRHGRWAWVRPWGWTWVDEAPWGFAPFHYGRWVHWGGRWCWAPGTYVRRPVYAPAMVAWVGGSNFSMSIRVGGGQPVGWVPLAPREQYYPAYRHSHVHIKQVNITHVTVINNVRPARPIMYRNTGVAGGVTVVSSDVLTRRQAVHAAARPADADVVRALHKQRGVTQVAPPTPANASLAPRQAVQPGRAARTPPPPRVGALATREAQADGKDVGGRPMGSRPDGAGNNRPDGVGNAAPTARPASPGAARPQAGAGHDDDRSPNGHGPAAANRPPAGQPDNARPRVARPPMTGAPTHAPNVQREPGQVVPQARRENDAPGLPQQREQREQRDQRDQRDQRREAPGFQNQNPRERDQRETREVPGFQQREAPRAVQPAPQPHPAPRERQVEHRQPERQQQERPQERRREHKENDRRDGANSLN
ncbi:MAG TPA: DUF6600 domain-containing protein [Ideonella sp.]|uniref:DUF6600 domain-containing protein n=1 Tax=Ideonella sp. TaxID=1929293 RepID=UPI002E34BD2D|nr:DUF6600 domain-containing protein [Ideonella sp.]HEX5682884.1 DUF6600 domain-containing protein [Ideonella sp.]